MAYLNMVATVAIGGVKFEAINSFEIEDSIYEVSGKATVTIPRNYKMLDGNPVLDYIKPGLRVTIIAGYIETGVKVEFTGWVKSVSADIPIKIVCDQVYTLRGNNIVKSYAAVKLKQLLEDITENVLSFSGEKYVIQCPDVNLGKLLISNESAYRTLLTIKQDFGFYSRIYDNVLYVGFAWDWKPGYTKRHIYKIQGNVKDAGELKFKAEKDFNTKVRVKINHPNGKVEYVEAGSKEQDAAVTEVLSNARSKEEALLIAKARLKQFTYDGYTGSITGFGHPAVHAGDSLEIIDTRYPERQGTYLVEKVVQNFSVNGYQRECTISYKI